MAVKKCLENLPYHRLYMWYSKGLAFVIKILLHIKVEVFKNKVDSVLTMNNVHQTNDSFMF
jgi:hypothetical protein